MEVQIYILCAFAFQMIQNVAAIPARDHPYKPEHCIKMDQQKEKEINNIVTRITDFLNNISTEFDNYDIRFIKIDIESHSEDETEEKELKLQLTVNDCLEDDVGGDSKEKYDDTTVIEVTSEDPDVSKTIIVENMSEEVAEKCPCSCNVEKKHDDINTNAGKDKLTNRDNESPPVETIWFFDMTKDNDENILINNNVLAHNEITDRNTNKIQSKYPELMPLELTGVGEDVWDILEKRFNNKPLLVYVQSKIDQDEYIFL
ncbi:uncharacterized protein LOC106134372 [Amyelois transitella]|uniref:uncharacterized protein LOC106134372 n=1 Tax=Amyelois transitella TaxID=680683 RepID=UPI00067C6F75|nr:uncharacterized protein LOC106134372 [Amyelois transitella]